MFSALKTLFTSVGTNPETKAQVRASYQKPLSFSELVRWAEYDAPSKSFLLDDGKSVAAIFELEDVPSEARSVDYLTQLQQGFQGVFQDVFPQYFDNESPWILQIYLQDEPTLEDFVAQLQTYAKSEETAITQEFKKLMQEHIHIVTQPEGLFTDTKVSGLPFRGKRRRIRAVIYRKLTNQSKLRSGRSAIDDLTLTATVFTAKLQSSGVNVKRLEGADFYRWMVAWFNPKPHAFNSTEELLKHCPYPGDDAMPYGYDFAERFFFSAPHSDEKQGVWYFDDCPHKYLTILGLNHLPHTGHLTAERVFGNRCYGLFDEFPEGSVFVMTVVIKAQEQVLNHLDRIEYSASRSSSEKANMTREDCKTARRAIESGNYLFPTSMGVYLRGKDVEDLARKEIEVESSLIKNGFCVLAGDHNLMRQDSYVRYLPCCYDYSFDKAYLFRSRYLTGKQLSQLMPLYGRERGTGHPLFTFFNRGGEALTVDPFHPQDKDFNSHIVLLGTTGSGKSATAGYLMLSLISIYKPRLVIVDMGNSFQLLGEYFKSQGLSVNRVEISFSDSTSLNPFAMSQAMLKQIEHEKKRQQADFYAAKEKSLQDDIDALQAIDAEAGHEETKREEERFENRDYLGEMCLSAQLMVTGSEEGEKLSRQNRYLLLKAIIQGAETAEAQGRDQMIAKDLMNALMQHADVLEEEHKSSNTKIIQELKKMAHHIRLFCEDNLSANYFNRPGEVWPIVDVTILELGIFKEEGYEAQRALAFLGAMNKTMSLAERTQYQNRMTFLFTDELHNIIKNPITASLLY